ncbi:flagellar hook-basal body protein [Alicyclobacillaceae bacterium I2511]|nr:flagellar hook-basal body protein [Alicyclobacillaceae bacterium I2511]
MRSAWIDLSGLQAGQTWLNRVANNLANLNTPGYAAEQGSFADAYTQALMPGATAPAVAARVTPEGWWGGYGVLPTGAAPDFSQMSLQTTGNPLNLAIEGEGFFLVGGGPQPLLTKAGNFIWSRTASGQFELATASGQPVLDIHGKPILALHNDTAGFAVSPTGQVSFAGKASGQTLALATVNLPDEKLTPAGDNMYTLLPGGQLTIANQTGAATGQNSGLSVHQGMLAMSNVDATAQLADMLQAQNLYALSASALQMTTKMAQANANIHS